MGSRIAIVAFSILAAAGCARGPAEPWASDDPRVVIDYVVRAAPRIGDDGRAMPDLTSTVNALLAMDSGEVLAALADGLDAFRSRGTHRDDCRVTLESLCALLVGVEHEPDETWQVGATLQVHQGFVLVAFLGDGTFFSGQDQWTPPLPLEGYTKGATALRPALEPDGPALLGHLCEGAEMPRPFRDDRELRVSAGLALGFAARSDPALADRIVAEGKGAGGRQDRLEVLAFALGRLATDEAARTLQGLFIEAATRRDDALLYLLVGAARAGLSEEFLARVWRRIAEIVPEAVERFEWAAAGEVVARAALEAVREDRTDARLETLGRAVLGQALSSLSAETFRAVLDLGVESGRPDVVTALLWPLDRDDAQSPGYPDPLEQARRFRDDLEEGRITLRPQELDSPGIYAETVSAGPPDSGVRLEASIEGDRIRVTMRNGGAGPCSLDPVAFEYGILELRASAWKEGDPWDPDEEVPHLRLGRVATGTNPTVPADDLVVLEPGESRTTSWPLGEGIPADGRAYVLLQDEISVEGDLPAPLLRYAGPVRVR